MFSFFKGGVNGYIVSEALKPAVEEAKEYVKQAEVVNADETGHKEKGQKRWVWVAVAGLISVFLVRVSRGAIVAKELLGESFKGILNPDRYAAYN